MPKNSNTGGGGAEVDTNSTLLGHFDLKLDLKFSNVENSVAMYFIMQVPQCLLVQELSSQSEENKSIWLLWAILNQNSNPQEPVPA